MYVLLIPLNAYKNTLIGNVGTKSIEEIISINNYHYPESTFTAVLEEYDQIFGVLSFVLHVIINRIIYHKMEYKCNLGKF